MDLVSWLTRATVRNGVAVIAAGVLLASLGSGVQAKEVVSPAVAETSLNALPPQAQETHRLVHTGGPFPYAKDGSVFGNRERVLPRHPRGYYREYTVKTPGARNRGARRLICGGQPPTAPEVCYYTDDHYASFKRVSAQPAR